MMSGERCIFCDRPAAEWHHPPGRNHCTWFRIPLCIHHHRLVTAAYDNADRTIMKRASSPAKRIIRALKACVVFMWLLLDQIDLDKEEKFNVCTKK
jgi:hypothetical protein